MSKMDVIQRARVITDSLADDVAKAYARRAGGVKGPITVKELPEDVVVKMVDTVKDIAPEAARKKAASKFKAKNYALIGGGTIAGATLFNLDDLGFVDLLLKLTPSAQTEVVADAAESDAAEGTDVARGIQAVGDLLHIHQLQEQDFDAHRSMMPLDRSIQAGLGLQNQEIQQLQALTDVLDLAIGGLGSLEVLEAVILLSNNTTPEDRLALFDNLKYRRGY